MKRQNDEEKKLNWGKIFGDFIKRNRKYEGHVRRFNPIDYTAIEIILKEGGVLTYDYETKKVKKIK